MHEHRRLAAVELFHDRHEGRIAEIFGAVARHHADALGLQRVEAVGDLGQRVVDIRQRQSDEHAEAALVIGHHARLILVAVARQRLGLVEIAEEHAGIAGGDHGGGDARRVHGVERFLQRPGFVKALAGAAALHHRQQRRRGVVMVHVDDVGGRRVSAFAVPIAGNAAAIPSAEAPRRKRRRLSPPDGPCHPPQPQGGVAGPRSRRSHLISMGFPLRCFLFFDFAGGKRRCCRPDASSIDATRHPIPGPPAYWRATIDAWRRAVASRPRDIGIANRVTGVSLCSNSPQDGRGRGYASSTYVRCRLFEQGTLRGSSPYFLRFGSRRSVPARWAGRGNGAAASSKFACQLGDCIRSRSMSRGWRTRLVVTVRSWRRDPVVARRGRRYRWFVAHRDAAGLARHE